MFLRFRKTPLCNIFVNVKKNWISYPDTVFLCNCYVVLLSYRPLIQKKLSILSKAGLSKDDFGEADTTELKVNIYYMINLEEMWIMLSIDYRLSSFT